MRGKSPTSASQLPERLRYLQPFRKKFASQRAEDLNEDSGFASLIALFSKRIKGLSPLEAEGVLAEDLTALEQWLDSPANQNDTLQFARGVVLIVSPADLVNLIAEEADRRKEPKLRLHFELPPGAKLKRVQGDGEDGKLVTLKGLWLVLEAQSKESLEETINIVTGPSCGWPEYSEAPVQFGSVTGRKLKLKGQSWGGPVKQVDYALTVPGGHVHASISAISKKVDALNWDETPFEACFHTLRVETQPQPP